MLKLKKGDEIIVVRGKDKGKRGKIEVLSSEKGTVLVPGLNINKRHLKKRDEKNPGGIIDFPKPLPWANVALICPKCGKKTRVGITVKKDKKSRICKKCDSII